MTNKKGQGLSISTLVIIALAVFVIFLLIGFVTSGWGYFTDMFGSTLKHETAETAKLKCDGFCANWKAANSPVVENGGYWDAKLCAARQDLDLDGDGTLDSYTCVEFCQVQCPMGGGGQDWNPT